MMKLKLERMLQQILKSEEQKSEEMQQNKLFKNPPIYKAATSRPGR